MAAVVAADFGLAVLVAVSIDVAHHAPIGKIHTTFFIRAKTNFTMQ